MRSWLGDSGSLARWLAGEQLVSAGWQQAVGGWLRAAGCRWLAGSDYNLTCKRLPRDWLAAGWLALAGCNLGGRMVRRLARWGLPCTKPGLMVH